MRRDSREKQGDEEGTGLKHPVTDEQRSFSIEDQADSPRLCDLSGLTQGRPSTGSGQPWAE